MTFVRLMALFVALAVPSMAWNPFCALNPYCKDEKPEPIETKENILDVEFATVFGARPTLSQCGSLRPFQSAKADWEQNRRFFEGIVEVPSGAEDAFGYYESVGVPKPIFYKFRGEERGMFVLPEDPDFCKGSVDEDGKWKVKQRVYVSGPAEDVVAGNLFRYALAWQVRAINVGFCVEKAHAWLPVPSTLKNKANCGVEEEE